ncbi:MAG: peroxiredoxin [Rhodospirillaceae bacterium]|nr:peroxiredoxin [Rhodospirillaceae bacterium]MBT4751537.1 peroxiredoxin [Rhodospirillaceae bacterium]
MEGNGFRDRIQDFENQNTVILGASFDAPETNKAFRDKFDFPYDLLSDGDGAMSRAYGVTDAESEKSPRKSILIAPDGTIAAAYDAVVPAEHPDQVLNDLKRLS